MTQKKEQREIIVLAVLLVVAAAAWYFYFGHGSVSTSVSSAGGVYKPIDAQDFGLIFGPLKQSQATEYKTSGRNIFVAGPMPVAPPSGSGAAQKPVKPPYVPGGQFPQPPAPPPAPVLPWKYFGYGVLPSGGTRQGFLVDGDDVHIVSEGETVLSHIRITRIGTDKIEYEDTVTGMRNSNNLEVAPAT